MRVRFIEAKTETGNIVQGVCYGGPTPYHEELTHLGNNWIVWRNGKADSWPSSVTWVVSVREISKESIPVADRAEILQKALELA